MIKPRSIVGFDHVGMGVLLTPTRFLTCAHVVNVALGKSRYKVSAPDRDALVAISFPILEDGEQLSAHVIDWSPPGKAGLDCAVLELTTPAPEAASVSILSVVSVEDLLDDTMSIYGSLETGNPGAHVSAQVQGDVGAGWSQLSVNGRRGIQPGFSGAGVWAQDQRATVGVAIALQEETGGIVGYFLSAARIAEQFGALIPTEIRKISLRRQRSFTLLSVVLFLLVLAHFLGSTGSGSGGLVPWAQGSRRLAAFFGVHCFAIILGPYVMWHAMRHARSFAMRKWWMRVPAFTLSSRADMLHNTPIGSGAVVLFLLLLPAIGQTSMMCAVFFDDHQIYANVERLQLQNTAEATTCIQDDPKWCTHKTVGTWAFAPRLPYFDYVYRYGDACDRQSSCKLVTYFPTLQPLILLGGTGLGLMFFSMFLYALIRPWPYRSDRKVRRKEE